MNFRFVVVHLVLAFAMSAATALSQTIVPPMSSVELVSGDIKTYEPFDVRLTFREPRCVQPQSPRYSNVRTTRTEAGGFEVAAYLSQLDGNALSSVCGTQQIVRMPGLPSGQHRLRFFVTSTQLVLFSAPLLRAATTPVESGVIAVNVARLPNEQKVAFTTCERNGSMMMSLSLCTVQPGPNSTVEPIRVLEVEAASAPGVAFYATVFSGAAKPPFVPLYAIEYPSPYAGMLWTTSASECEGLRSAWGMPLDRCDAKPMYVLTYKDGVCPVGSQRVYRLFNPKAVEHRYTQDEALVPFLVGLGFISEGAVFCAPSQ
jgi:hypothetical protein